MKNWKQHISLFMVALAQVLMVAHAVIPHHHHHAGSPEHDKCCEHHMPHDLAMADHEEHEECCSPCNFLNTLFSQLQIDSQFVQEDTQTNYSNPIQVSEFLTFEEIAIKPIHLVRHSLRAPPIA